MTQINYKTKSEDFDATLAKEICQIVGLVPSGYELKDVSDVFERILTVQEGSHLLAHESLRPHFKAALRGLIDPISSPEYDTLLLQIRTVAAIDALTVCSDGLPIALTEYFQFRPIDSHRAYDLLRQNLRYEIGFDDFIAHGNAYPEWLSFATRYAEILDACQRYMTLRSWCERLDRLAMIGGTFFKYYADGWAPLLMKEDLFRTGKLTISNGIISIEADKFTEAFVGAPIERIRRCEACKRIYWADRIDMKGCGSACAKIIRMRNWRSKPENREKEQYRDYKRYEKKRKEKK